MSGCVTRSVRLEFRRDTASNWTAANPVLKAGEPGFEVDTGRLKIGNGTTPWNSLPYQGTSSGAQGVFDGGGPATNYSSAPVIDFGGVL